MLKKNKNWTHIQCNNRRIWHVYFIIVFTAIQLLLCIFIAFVYSAFFRTGFSAHARSIQLGLSCFGCIPSSVWKRCHCGRCSAIKPLTHGHECKCVFVRVSLSIVLRCACLWERTMCVFTCMWLTCIHSTNSVFNFSDVRFIIGRRSIWTFYVHKFPVNFGHFTSETIKYEKKTCLCTYTKALMVIDGHVLHILTYGARRKWLQIILRWLCSYCLML